MTLKVVVTDYEYENLEPEREVFEPLGIELIPAQCHTEREVIEAAKDAHGLISQYAPITRNVIENLPHCKVISRYGIGVDTIDVKAASDRGIIVGNVPDYCIDEVSDHALALLLTGARKIIPLHQAIQKGKWDYKIGVPIYRLRGLVLGLVGFGRIPQQVARKAQAFGLRVIAYDPFIPGGVAESFEVKLVQLDELCAQSDFISVHAPLLASTRGMIGEEQFRRMKKGAIIVNTARGPIIQEEALIRALQERTISGACLDVVEQEPIDESNPLLSMDNVILTPHISWYSEESQNELKRKTAQNVARVLIGERPDYIVNPIQ
ncbi:C-terminal binding protein [Paenibacillus tarimensis]|uniref:C-terminal binding protein n=1 Tax=Paenibacillus tarimensis TaxID=416012 RepID=UPI001F3E6462|nr:C-terminal binding protein [Paenibacillus tarimensis]MCF2944498.1 C-terminal binding protein [Paenibacillus tarimensis]